MPDDKVARDLVTTEKSPGSLLNFVADAVTNKDVDVAKLQALLQMQREVEADDAKRQFTAAFIRLQSRLPRIKKEGVLSYPVDKNKPDGPQRVISHFARWEDIDRELRPLLAEEGFALSFRTEERAGGGLIVSAVLLHQAGHSSETKVPVAIDTSGGKNNLQGYGSAISYGKRYAATAALNIIAEGEDDDGKSGGLKLMTQEHVLDLEKLIVDTGADRDRFLKVLNVERLEHLDDEKFATTREMLIEAQEKRRAKAGAKR